MDHSQDSSPLTLFKDQDRYAWQQPTICTALARTGEFVLAEDNLAPLTADRKSGCEPLYHYNYYIIRTVSLFIIVNQKLVKFTII